MNKQLIAAILFVVTAAFARLIPHPPNVTPIAAMALFGGAFLANRKLAFALPLAAMLLSDLVLGYTLYGKALFLSQPVVYLAIMGTVAIGRCLHANKRWDLILLAALGSSIMFFIVTNFAVWAFGSLYTSNWTGLVACYAAAIPFFRNSLAGDLSFAVILFGSYALLAKSSILLPREVPGLTA